MVERTDVTFGSGGTVCRAWHYPPPVATGGHPVIVMAHGLGAIRDMRLDAYAERFQRAGYGCLVFDYRHFGDSDGTPRQLVDINRQLADWNAAVDFARKLPEVDRIVLWGTSFSGGHVIHTAAGRDDIAAVISQCPFTDGLASSWPVDLRASARLLPLIVSDLFAAVRGAEPTMVSTTGEPGSVALITAPGASEEYSAMAPEGSSFRNEVAARLGLRVPLYAPGRKARDVKCPILFCVCDLDEVAPADATVRHASKAPLAEIVRYPFGHFTIYRDSGFERAVADQIDFLQRHLGGG